MPDINETKHFFERQLDVAEKQVKAFESRFKGQISNYRYDTEIYKIAISALEKQIPKKVNHDKEFCPTCGANYEYLFCLDCGSTEFRFDYCANCGQKLDWSEYGDWKKKEIENEDYEEHSEMPIESVIEKPKELSQEELQSERQKAYDFFKKLGGLKNE